MAELSDYNSALKQKVINADLGGSGTTSSPAYTKMVSANGTAAYIFAANDGSLRTHTAVPTSNTAGSALVSTIGDGAVTGAKLTAGKGYFTVTTATNSTTAVNVFGVGGAPTGLVVTGVFVISKDTTASNIIVKQAANTVCTIAKGTAAGALVGATSLANATYTAADVCTVESSGAGEAFVVITFTVV